MPFICAWSAATYGDGARDFVDDPQFWALKTLPPMNLLVEVLSGLCSASVVSRIMEPRYVR
jgi:hypothetical protein